MGVMPWYREVGGQIRVGPRFRGGPVGPAVADIIDSGVGTSSLGEIVQLQNLELANGTLSPPAHAFCRCTLEPA